MKERDIEALREAAAEFLSREALPPPAGGLITVTRAEISDNRRSGIIYMTVYPTESEDAAVRFANRNRTEFSKFFESRVRGMRAPRVEFVIDKGEKNRQRLDELSS